MSTKQTEAYWAHQTNIRDTFYNVLMESIEEAEKWLKDMENDKEINKQTFAECLKLLKEEKELERGDGLYDEWVDNEMQEPKEDYLPNVD